MRMEHSGGITTLTANLSMAQHDRPNDGDLHNDSNRWKHMNSLEVSSFGSLDDIRSFTESPVPSPSTNLLDSNITNSDNIHHHDTMEDESNHHHTHHESHHHHHPSSISVPAIPAARPLVNAVHMEMQENSRLPTFNMAVDRSNSHDDHHNNSHSNKAQHPYYNPTALSPQTRKEIDDLIRLEEYDKSLSEYFLKSDQRSSLTLTYEAAGALLDELLADPHVFDTTPMTLTGTNSGMTSRSDSQRNMMLKDDVTAPQDGNSMDDHHHHHHHDDDDKKLPATTTTASTTSAASTMDSNHHHRHVLLEDEDLVNMMVVEPTPLEQIKARGAQWNLQQQQHRYYYPVVPRHSPLPIPTGISMNVVATPNKDNSNDNDDEKSNQPLEQPQQHVGGIPSEASLTTSPLSSALATAAAIAAASAATSTSTLTPTKAAEASSTASSSVTSDHKSNNTTFFQSNQHSSFHRFPTAAAAAATNHATTLLSSPFQQSSASNKNTNKEQEQQPLLSSPVQLFASATPKSPQPLSLPFLPVLQPNKQQQYRRGPHPLLPAPTPATSNVKTTQAMATAAKLKSQFGFGDNHVVPSVPDPPPKPGTTKAPTSNAAPKVAAAGAAAANMTTPTTTRRISTIPVTAAAAAATNFPPNNNMGMKKAPHKPSSDNGTRDSGSPSSPTHTGEAYERKKQRAKDARVRLNESIERLSIAISMAGSQSKQRAGQLRDVTSTTSVMTDSKATSLIRIMEDASNTAEMAKKWDRPSFVGVAASLIQGLNAECEALMELVLTPMNTESATNTDNAEAQTIQDAPHHHEIKRSNSKPLSTLDVQTKRQRVGSVQDLAMTDADDGAGVTCEALLAQASIVQRLAFYFDPISLLRCQLVSSSWKKTGVFSSDILWMALSLARFGRHQVRQWVDSSAAHTTVPTTASMQLYRTMDEANIMPQFRHEGMIRLGEGRIGSKVSAWAFLVKRSNGETIRSVKREPSDGRHHHPATTTSCEYVPLPVVELRIVVQNTGMGNGPIVIKNQDVTVDASTRRRSEEYRSITWDDRLRMTIRKLDDDDDRRKMSSRIMDAVGDDAFKQSLWNAQGQLLDDQYLNPLTSTSNAASCQAQPYQPPLQGGNELCRLGLYDAQVLTVFLHTPGCSTMTKFQERSNFTKLLVCLNGTTVPLVIPFPREDANQ